MKNLIRIGVVLFGGVGLMIFSVRAADLRNRVVAYVNDEIITIYEMNKKIQEFTGELPEELKRQDEKKYQQLFRQILDDLIDEKLSQMKVRELGITVSEKQVETAIENRNKDLGLTREGLLAELKKAGLTYEKYSANVKKELEFGRLIGEEVKSKILIKEEKVRQYYQDHWSEYKTDDQVHLADIFLMRESPESVANALKLKETLEQIQKQIAKGADFGELAKAYSQGPGAESGGELGSFTMSQLDPELQRILEGLSEGEVSGPLVRPNGIQLVKLIKRETGKVKPFEAVRDAIYGLLYQEEIKTRYEVWIKELRGNSYVKIIL
ncbi:MAG: hypothetical protein EHM45_14320 [Desulfobacteraceae bacterium]|nr:MAG: hypothetical protein EHM45_14320 [Desulfobacteraceae bacterium]